MFSNKGISEKYWYFFVLIAGLLLCVFSLPEYKRVTFVFYAAVLLLSMIFIYQSEHIRNPLGNKILFSAGLFVIGAPMAFHEPTLSIDDHNYILLFDNAGRIDDLFVYLGSSDQEKGYLFLTWLSNKITGGNYLVFQIIRTYLTFSLWGLAIRKFKKIGSGYIILLFIWSHFYFFVLNSGLYRIFMAIPLVYLSFYYLWTNEWKKLYLCLLFASLIHLSALIILLFVPFSINPKYFYKHWIMFLIITNFVVFVGLLSMAQYLVPILGDRYQGYGEVEEFGMSIGTFTTLPIIIAVFYLYKQHRYVIEYRKLFILGLIILSLSIIFSLVSSMVHVGRINFYAYIGFCIVMPIIIQTNTKGVVEFFLKSMLIIYPLVYVMGTNMLNEAKTQLFPYVSFLFRI